ncbi:Ryanodine receptor [Taenia solium]|eukprot:TsM_001229300 transcript=TsM_001229300 gene=TsM_001229300
MKTGSSNGRLEEVSNSWFYITRLQEMDLQYLLWKGVVIFTDNLFLYLVVYFTVSLMGNADYFFFSCHLLDVAISFKTLTTIVQSVTHNGKQVGHTLLHPGNLVHHVVAWCRSHLTSYFTDPSIMWTWLVW